MSAVVLLHAFPLDHRMWDGVAAEIARAGWQVFTPDIRGFGQAPTWEDVEPSLTTCADDVIALLDQFGIEKAVVGGCSLGGYITMELLRRAPERVAAAILIGTKASADSDEARANRERVAQSVLSAGTSEAFCRAMLPTVLGTSTHSTRPDVVELTRDIMSDSTASGVAALQRAMSRRPDSADALAQFRGPVLSIRGDEDGVATERDHQDIVDFSLDAVHVTLLGVGHLVPLEAPQETAAAVVAFLEKVRRASC